MPQLNIVQYPVRALERYRSGQWGWFKPIMLFYLCSAMPSYYAICYMLYAMLQAGRQANANVLFSFLCWLMLLRMLYLYIYSSLYMFISHPVDSSLSVAYHHFADFEFLEKNPFILFFIFYFLFFSSLPVSASFLPFCARAGCV